MLDSSLLSATLGDAEGSSGEDDREGLAEVVLDCGADPLIEDDILDKGRELVSVEPEPGEMLTTFVDPVLDLQECLSKVCVKDPKLELLDLRDNDLPPRSLLGDPISSELVKLRLLDDRGVLGSTRGLTLELLVAPG